MLLPTLVLLLVRRSRPRALLTTPQALQVAVSRPRQGRDRPASAAAALEMATVVQLVVLAQPWPGPPQPAWSNLQVAHRQQRWQRQGQVLLLVARLLLLP
jgi:hypothetical protein